MAAGIYPMTPEETRLFLCMRPILEEVWVIADRAEVPIWKAMQRLEEMAHKGLVFAYNEEGEMPRYHPIRH